MERIELDMAKELGKLEDVVGRRTRLQAVSFSIAGLASTASAISAVEIYQNTYTGGDNTLALLVLVLFINAGYLIRNLRLLEDSRRKIVLLNAQLSNSDKMKNDEVQIRLGDDGELIIEESKPLQQQVKS